MAAAGSADPRPLVLPVERFSSPLELLGSLEFWPHMESSFGKQRYLWESLLCLMYAESLLTCANEILEPASEVETSFPCCILV